jgi:hypothetical protein
MFGPMRNRDPGRLAHADRVKSWTRTRFGLGADAAISVAELACALPGCPPVETAVMFWTADGRHYHFKVFKRLEEVVEDDLPPAWYRDALAVVAGVECSCC